MIASVVLAVSTSAIAGSLAASYQHQRAAQNASTAAVASERLLEELLALPTDGAETIDDLNNYADTLDTRTLTRTPTGDSSALTLTGAQSALNVVAPTSTVGGDDGNDSGDGVAEVEVDRVQSVTSKSTIDRASVTDKVQRRVSVMRRDAPGGPAVAGGQFVTIEVETEDVDGRIVRVKRLLSAAESEAR